MILDNEKAKNIFLASQKQCKNCSEKCIDFVLCEFKFTCSQYKVDFSEELLKKYDDICASRHNGCSSCSLGLYCIQNFIELKSLKKL